MIYPFFLLDFTDKEEDITTNFFKIESFIYKPSSTNNFQHVLTSDDFKTQKEYHSYLSKNNIHNITTFFNHLMDFLSL